MEVELKSAARLMIGVAETGLVNTKSGMTTAFIIDKRHGLGVRGEHKVGGAGWEEVG